MRYRMNILIYNRCRNIVFQESKRYAGHSKWQNIKHEKEKQDALKATTFHAFANKMRFVITKTGEMDPVKNTELAHIIEQAKKANMPLSTIKTCLEKMKNKQNKSEAQIIPVRGPGGSILIMYVASNNLVATKILLATFLKKNGGQSTDSSVLGMFDCACYVTASKECSLDQAMEDAININAKDVQEIKDNDETCFEFKYEFQSSNKIITQLKSLGYSVLSVEDICIPECAVELNEKDLKAANKLKQGLLKFDEVEKIDDNIVESEESV